MVMLPPRAYIFIALNAIRALTMIALILVFASNILTLVDDVKAVNAFQSAVQNSSTSAAANATANCDYIENSTVPNQPAGIFWAVVNRLLIILQTVVLFLSEVGWPYKFFDKFFPILGTHFGLGAPGLFQCFIGAAVLSHHVDDFALVAAFFLFSLGCVNIFVGLIFREKGKEKRSLLSWRAEKKKGLLPFVKDAAVSQAPAPLRPFLTNLSSQPPSFISRLSHTDEKAAADEKHLHGPGEFGQGRGYGWGRAAEKFAAGKGLLISKPVEALPPYGPGARVPPSISRPTATVEDATEDDENAQRRQGQPQFRSSNESL